MRLWAAEELGIADRTKVVKISHWEYWRRFCGVWNEDAATLGELGVNMEQERGMRLNKELEVISALGSFIVFDSRFVEKRTTTNSENYAEKVIYSVQRDYVRMQGRRPILTDGTLGGKQLLCTLRGLRKLVQIQMRVKLPILQRDLRMMCKVLDLESSHLDRTMCTLWLSQWKRVMRCGDLI